MKKIIFLSFLFLISFSVFSNRETGFNTTTITTKPQTIWDTINGFINNNSVFENKDTFDDESFPFDLKLNEMALSVFMVSIDGSYNSGFITGEDETHYFITAFINEDNIESDITISRTCSERIDAELVDYDNVYSLAIIRVEKGDFEHNLYVFDLDENFHKKEYVLSSLVFLGYQSGEMIFKTGFFERDLTGNIQHFTLDILAPAGSAGSPILNENGKVVGVYRSGNYNDGGTTVGISIYLRQYLDNLYGYVNEGDFILDDDLVPIGFENEAQQLSTFSYSIARIIAGQKGGTAFLFKETENYYYFMTNEHVTRGVEDVNIYLGPTSHRFEGLVIFEQDDLDVAIVKVSKEGVDSDRMHIFEFSSDVIQNGFQDQQLFTFGFPGLEPTFNFPLYEKPSSSYAQDRSDMLISLDLTPGASGSPILNEQLEVVGLFIGHITFNSTTYGHATVIDEISLVISSIEFE